MRNLGRLKSWRLPRWGRRGPNDEMLLAGSAMAGAIMAGSVMRLMGAVVVLQAQEIICRIIRDFLDDMIEARELDRLRADGLYDRFYGCGVQNWPEEWQERYGAWWKSQDPAWWKSQDPAVEVPGSGAVRPGCRVPRR